MSLRWRLIGGIVVVLSALWIVTAIWYFFDVRAELREVLDARMASSARMVQGLLDRQELRLPQASTVPNATEALNPTSLPDEMICQLWSLDGKLITTARGGPLLPATAIPDGISNQVLDGERWRVFALTDPANGVRILTAERRDLRRSLIMDMALKLAAPLALVLPAMVLLIWVAVRRGLVPLERLRRSVQARSADALEPIPTEGVPQELTPMVNALNSLFARLASAFERERRFTGDAAHELRTPLAGIKTQLQVARAAEGVVRERALAQAEAGLDRMSRLVTQMLVLARLEGHPAVDPLEPGSCELAGVVETVLRELQPVSTQRKVGLVTQGAMTGIKAPLPASLLHTALRNLVENALNHSPPGSQVVVAYAVEPGRRCLSVLDTGPGLPPEELAQVTRRFYRTGNLDHPGTGLGLSIVAAITQRYGLQLHLENRRDAKAGLAARLEFPAATVAAGTPAASCPSS